jgi:hypothetical protein
VVVGGGKAKSSVAGAWGKGVGSSSLSWAGAAASLATGVGAASALAAAVATSVSFFFSWAGAVTGEIGAAPPPAAAMPGDFGWAFFFFLRAWCDFDFWGCCCGKCNSHSLRAMRQKRKATKKPNMVPVVCVCGGLCAGVVSLSNLCHGCWMTI